MKYKNSIKANIKIIQRTLLEIQTELIIEEKEKDIELNSFLDIEHFKKIIQCKKHLQDSMDKINS